MVGIDAIYLYRICLRTADQELIPVYTYGGKCAFFIAIRYVQLLG